jgi:hypothetical protein
MRGSDASGRRTETTLSSVLGLGLVVLAVLLAWPGVHAVRADEDVSRADVTSEADLQLFLESTRVEPAATESLAGPTCSAPGDPNRTAAGTVQNLAGEVERLRGAGESTAAGDVVVLNNRGYNYRAAPSPQEIERIRAAVEARRAAAP